MRDINSTSRWESFGPKTGATHYNAQLGLSDKGCAIVCCSMAKIYELWYRSMDKRKVRGLVPCCGQDGYRAQVLQHSIDSYNI